MNEIKWSEFVQVDWWEGLVTLLLFGAFILMSYTIDRKNEACALGFRYVGIYDPEDQDATVAVANGEGGSVSQLLVKSVKK